MRLYQSYISNICTKCCLLPIFHQYFTHISSNQDLEIVSEKIKKLEEKISEKDEHLKQMEITIREKSEKNDELEKILAGNYPNKKVQF